MSQMLLNIPIQRLREYARQTQAELHSLQISTLTGGYVAAGVYRIDMHSHSGDNDTSTTSYIQKHTTAREVRIMQLLAQHLESEALPTLIDAQIDAEQPQNNGTSWFISPFYKGETLTLGDEMPLSIVKALAAVHSFFANRVQELDFLPALDDDYISRLLNIVQTQLAANSDRLTDSIFTDLKRQMNALGDATILLKALHHLPKTLTHGDLHSGNIIRHENGSHILFDWGNAHRAPAMLDLANMVTIHKPMWQAYLQTWQELNSTAFDLELMRIGYHWAVAIVNLQYLPFAMSHLEPTVAQTMMGKVTHAVSTLQKSL